MEVLKKLTLLNSSLLTNYGSFEFRSLTLDEARELVRNAKEVVSAIGHISTAEILSELLAYPVEQNRIEYSQQAGERALIFKLRSRPPEGAILDRDQIEKIGYEFGVLIRLA